MENKQVNFEQLKELESKLYDLSEAADAKYYLPSNFNELMDNYMLFMEWMGKSSSFAHKAHKELRDE